MLQAVTLVLLARSTSPDVFALVAAALGLSVFASALTDLGVTPASTRETVHRPESLRGLRRLNSEVAAIVGLAVFASMLVGAYGLNSHILAQLSPFALWLFAERLAEFRFAVLVGLGAGATASFSVVIRKIAPLITLILSVTIGIDPVLAISSGYLLGSIASLAVGRGRIADLFHATDRSVLSRRSAFALSSPFWINSISSQVRQLDVAIVGAGGGAIAASSYAPASRLVSPLLLIPTTLAQAALPSVTRDPTNHRAIRRLFIVGLVPISGMYLIGIVLAPSILPALLGAAYADAAPVIQVLLVGLVAASFSSMVTSVLQASGHEREAALVNVLWSVVAIGVLFIGSLSGSVGAAIAMSLGYYAQALTLLFVWLKFGREGRAAASLI